MSIQRAYQRRCDDCGKLHIALCDTARRSLAAMKRDGWVHRQVVVGRMNRPDYALDPQTGRYEPTGEMWSYDITSGKDFCAECKDKAANQ